MGTTKRTALLMVLCALGIALGGGTAHADGAPVGADIQVAQTLGARELTVIIRRIDVTPGDLHVDIATHAGTAPGTLRLAAAADGIVFSRGDVVLGATPGLYSGTVGVDHAGPWELRLTDGTTTATIPFVVPARVVPPWEKAAYGGFVAAGALLLIALVVAVRSRRTAYALLPTGGMVAALAVAVTGALLSTGTPPPPAPGAQLDATVDNVTDPYALSRLPGTDYSRPPVNLTVGAQGKSIALHFTDGSTGRPADDLVIHDDALVHLIVVSPSGRLWHLHPVRVAPGEYRVDFTPPESGTYAVAAELERRGGGVQLARSTVDFSGGTGNPAEVPAGPGKRVVDGVRIDVTTTAVQARTPVTVTAHFPTGDLQPWLGMLGHLIVVGPLPSANNLGAAAATAPTWAHAHAMPPYVPGLTGVPDETVAAYGPDVPFTFTFPAPGRYRLWLQAERNWSVLTVPVVLDVPAVPGGGQ
ncbi:hypothetical protein [Amycolatopsis sp. DSM 110486]|uniref:hypothetical protein n=1 Tax=Amycolatopsis sp. DSM 110486 TaxID=2865832 RepID=UPI001C69C8CC|nr:hypothetical protein [Amycolatopsis sp. DSM 110486]QYN24648.1 hypothetical protein K1T34_20735 [Amycolatopsis sp. DSM 110486]